VYVSGLEVFVCGVGGVCVYVCALFWKSLYICGYRGIGVCVCVDHGSMCYICMVRLCCIVNTHISIWDLHRKN
jgi:hypothetical protein